MATKIAEGRARVTLKIRTSTISTDMTGAEMPKDSALAIYQIALGGRTDLVASLRTRRAIEAARTELAKGERAFSRLLDDIEATLEPIA